MAKRKRKKATTMPMPSFELSPEKRLEMEAEDVADAAIKADPAIRKRRDQIRARVLKAAKAK